MRIKKIREDVQKECLDILIQHKRVTAAISMGVGKTYIALSHMDYFLKEINPDAKFLVVAPKKSIFNSWFEEMNKFGLSYLKDRVTVTTYLSLQKQSLNYDVLYLDECHNLLYSHNLWLSNYENRIVGLTGTPPRFRNSEKGEMVHTYCPIMFDYVTDDAIEDKILNDYNIIIHPVNLSHLNTHLVKYKDKSFMTSEIKNYNYWTEKIELSSTPRAEQFSRIARMRALMEYKTKENYTLNLIKSIDEKCIIFCNTKEQADRMCKHSYYSGNPDNDINLEMFKRDEIQRLSCVLQLNEGINIPNLKVGIILHSYGNERKSAQRIGRLLRLNPDDVSTVHILMYHETIDKVWVSKALEDFDPKKITIKDVYNS